MHGQSYVATPSVLTINDVCIGRNTSTLGLDFLDTDDPSVGTSSVDGIEGMRGESGARIVNNGR